MLFTKDDCDFIKSQWDKNNVLDESTNKYAEYKGNKVKLKTSSVKANYVNITNPKVLNFVLDKLNPLGIKSISNRQVSIMKYVAGQYFGPHKDYSDYGTQRLNRTIVVQLSDDKEYTGGDLIVENKPQSRSIGSCISIRSNQIHEVTKITAGTRMTLVVFLLDKDIIFNTSLI